MNRSLLVLAVSFSLLAGAPVVSIMANEDSDSQEAQQNKFQRHASTGKMTWFSRFMHNSAGAKGKK